MFFSLKTQLFKTLFPGRFMRRKHRAFRRLLEHDRQGQLSLARLEEIFYDRQRVDFSQVRRVYQELSRHVAGVIDGLAAMALADHVVLAERFSKIDLAIEPHLKPLEEAQGSPYTIALNEINAEALPSVGGKAIHLARIAGALPISVPAGFVVTAEACRGFYRANGLRPQINALLAELDIHSPTSLNQTSQQLVTLIHDAPLPDNLDAALRAAYRNLPRRGDSPLKVAVRSSAVAEDSELSFAGQYRTLLNVGPETLAEAYKAVLASKYSPQALYYRIRNGLLDEETDMAVLVLELIAARASGVLYTRDPLNPESRRMMLHAIRGFGEPLVSGAVTPAVWTLEVDAAGVPRIAHSEAADQPFQQVLAPSGESRETPLSPEARHSTILDAPTALALANWGIDLESYFGGAQDIEWCQDANGALYLLQCRPLETYTQGAAADECRIEEVQNELLLSGGIKASAGVGSGRVHRIRQGADLGPIPAGSVLVVHTTTPEMAQAADRLSAVVADVGSSAGHFASIAREFGIPMLVNTRKATQVLAEGQTVTVFADQALVFAGKAESLLNGACGQVEPPADRPFFHRLSAILEHVSRLNLLDPQSPAFTPENCLTLHDILRYAHEQAIRAMFALGAGGVRQLRGARRLETGIPLTLYVVDLGREIPKTADPKGSLRLEDIRNTPFQALWKGLRHPDIHWAEDMRHFDWEAFDRMSGGVISKDAPELSSYALLSRDYLNLNFRFGYHFVVVDTLCGDQDAANYAFLSFKGGGGLADKRRLRARFLAEVLTRSDFNVALKGDLVEAQLRRQPQAVTAAKLDLLGRLLGCTRLLDMALEDEGMVADLVEQFLDGNYRFGPFARPQPDPPY